MPEGPDTTMPPLVVVPLGVVSSKAECPSVEVNIS